MVRDSVFKKEKKVGRTFGIFQGARMRRELKVT
jgi:hypothetical protein